MENVLELSGAGPDGRMPPSTAGETPAATGPKVAGDKTTGPRDHETTGGLLNPHLACGHPLPCPRARDMAGCGEEPSPPRSAYVRLTTDYVKEPGGPNARRRLKPVGPKLTIIYPGFGKTPVTE